MEHYYVEKGAFKSVRVYKDHVVKTLKEDSEDTGYGYDSCSTGWEEQLEELQREYQFAKKYSRFSVVPKVLWYDEGDSSLAMEKVEDVGFRRSCVGKKEEVKVKSIINLIAKKVVKYGIRKPVRGRLEDIVEYAVSHNLPTHNIVQDGVELILLDEMTCILDDMHHNNYGHKRGHIVIIDMGQTNSYKEVRSYRKNKSRDRFVKQSIVNRVEGKELEDLVFLLGAKADRRKVRFVRGNRSLEVNINKIEFYHWQGLRVFYGKGEYITVEEDGWRIER